jgi:hypothetical protein
MADDLGRTRHIRKINDQFRRDMPHGCVKISREFGQLFSNDELRSITQIHHRGGSIVLGGDFVEYSLE